MVRVSGTDLFRLYLWCACRGTVRSGPFKGMRYVRDAVGSAWGAKLIGTYERELHPLLNRWIGHHYQRVVIVGAAEGYYAVGFALKAPEARIIAFEGLEQGRTLMLQLARSNRLELNRLDVRGWCDVANLQDAVGDGDSTLVICDVEGAERELMQPNAVPGLIAADLIIELHEFKHRGIGEQLRSRFAESHQVTVVHQTMRTPDDCDVIGTNFLPVRYRQWATAEFRPEPMSWLCCQANTMHRDEIQHVRA
jgi:hypothetical protein